MKLIADSGSSKTDWLLVDENEQLINLGSTAGINPLFLSNEAIFDLLSNSVDLTTYKAAIKLVYFYGASCSSNDRVSKIKSTFSQFFSNALIEVEHDLLGAARAACGNNAGIVSIMGTGSNCCLYNGKEIVKELGGLGYVLGDEASGAHLGKLLVADFLNEALPEIIYMHLQKELKLNREGIIQKIYKESNPNKYLATFAKVYTTYIDTEYIQKQLNTVFNSFIEKYILKLMPTRKVACSFIGSIAHHFKRELQLSCKTYSLEVDTIIDKPIQALGKYHSAKVE